MSIESVAICAIRDAAKTGTKMESGGQAFDSSILRFSLSCSIRSEGILESQNRRPDPSALFSEVIRRLRRFHRFNKCQNRER
jgi:hypothetical protein